MTESNNLTESRPAASLGKVRRFRRRMLLPMIAAAAVGGALIPLATAAPASALTSPYLGPCNPVCVPPFTCDVIFDTYPLQFVCGFQFTPIIFPGG